MYPKITDDWGWDLTPAVAHARALIAVGTHPTEWIYRLQRELRADGREHITGLDPARKTPPNWAEVAEHMRGYATLARWASLQPQGHTDMTYLLPRTVLTQAAQQLPPALANALVWYIEQLRVRTWAEFQRAKRMLRRSLIRDAARQRRFNEFQRSAQAQAYRQASTSRGD